MIDRHALDWLLQLPFDSATLLYAFLIGIYVPIAATRARARLEASPQPIGRAFRRNAAASQIVMLLLGMAVGWTHGIRTLPLPPARWLWVWVLPALGIGETLRAVVRRSMTVEQRRALWVRNILPSRAELPEWTALTLLASFTEEITYRGLLFGILATTSGSLVLASALCAVSFGAAHAPQGLRSQILIGTLSLLLHALVILTGSLLPAMAVHAAANLISGIRAPAQFRDLGPVPPRASSAS
jgi:membrane protease YdiL (CAAX protease family)